MIAQPVASKEFDHDRRHPHPRARASRPRRARLHRRDGPCLGILVCRDPSRAAGACLRPSWRPGAMSQRRCPQASTCSSCDRLCRVSADLGRLAVVGLLYVTAYAVLLNIGELTVPAGPASFIINTMPVFTALIALPVLKESFGPWGWVGTAISFAGVGLDRRKRRQGPQPRRRCPLHPRRGGLRRVSTILQKPLLGGCRRSP